MKQIIYLLVLALIFGTNAVNAQQRCDHKHSELLEVVIKLGLSSLKNIYNCIQICR
jgi:hypothetical protein